MSTGHLILLAGAGFLAGVCGAVAGLASLVSFPALLSVGLSPVSANVTNTVALVLSSVGSSAASQPELRGQGVRVRRLLAVTAAGGVVGAVLLLLTPPAVFRGAVPVLVASGSLLLLLQPRIAARWSTVRAALPGARAEAPAGEQSPGVVALLFTVAVYGGYFGAGAGTMMLAVLALSVPEPLTRVNALKNVGLGAANAVAAAGFALFGPVRWAVVAPLALGFLAGGAASPPIVRRLPEAPLRVAVSLAGLGLALKLAFDALH